MAQGRRGCGCLAAVLLVVLAGGGFAAWRFLKPWWDARQARQTPEASGKELQVHVFDVGLGDSVLIVAPSGKTVLVDAGPTAAGKKVVEALKRLGVGQLDYFVATHAHADHVGGAGEVFKAVNVGRVYYSGFPIKGTREYDDFLKAVQQKNVPLERATPDTPAIDLGDGALLRVLAPTEPFFEAKDLANGGNEPNANSVVMRLDYGDFSMLLAGDAEEQTERRMVEKGSNFAAKVLKVSHHGSKYATSADFLKRGGFKSAIISTGADNRYGLPAQETLDRLKAAGLRLYRTDAQGEITVSTRGQEGDTKITAAREPKTDLWVGLPALRDDSAKRGFINFGDLPPAPKPTPQKANSNSNTNSNRNARGAK